MRELDWGELEGYRSVYAQALVQIRKDLASPVQQFFVSEYGTGRPVSHDWPVVIISHLAALERDKHGIDESLFVPSLPFAVALWMTDRLLQFGMMGREPRDAMQLQINQAVNLRLDSVYGQGDPLLCAVCIDAFPKTVSDFASHIGLRKEMADEVSGRLIDEARKISQEAWLAFNAKHEPSKVSMFRPPKSLKPSGGRQYYR